MKLTSLLTFKLRTWKLSQITVKASLRCKGKSFSLYKSKLKSETITEEANANLGKFWIQLGTHTIIQYEYWITKLKLKSLIRYIKGTLEYMAH